MKRIPIKSVFENHQYRWAKVVGRQWVLISHAEFAALAESNREFLSLVYGVANG